MKNCITIFALVLLAQACSPKLQRFSTTSMPTPPDYVLLENWAAHPDKKDFADRTPNPSMTDNQATAQVDIFFLHPTTLIRKPKEWNAPVSDEKLNQKTDETAILHQASIFNSAGRVFAPRYRQAHFQAFFTTDKQSADAALEVAYEDVKSAFEHYLAHENKGQPIIIASHSQGALHAKRLLKDFFDGKPLQRKLVAAYIVGWPVRKGEFATIPPCETAQQTGCICSWRSFKYGYLPENYTPGDSILVTNPLTWTTTGTPAPKELNEGTVLADYEKVLPKIADAKVHDGLLWVHKPKFPGSIFFTEKNYHIADFNLFHANVRKNAQQRVDAFWKE